MIKRIDLFMPPAISQYGVLHHFTKKLYEAFLRLGVKVRILEAQRNNPKPFLTELLKDVPDCTLSFNGLLPDDEGRFFCDLIRIPHVAWVVDSPNGFVSLANSPLTIIASVDRNACTFFKGIHSQNVLFLPHGVEKGLQPNPKVTSRGFEVVLLSSCIDYQGIKDDWVKKFPPPLTQALNEAVDITLYEPKISYVNAFVQVIDKYTGLGKIDPKTIDYLETLDELEMVVRGKARVDLIRSIKETRVDIFGEAQGTTTWKKQLGTGSKNIVFHEAVPFDQALEIMQNSKIVLSSSSWIKDGVHERILAGLACGALVLTEDYANPYLNSYFQDGKNIALYKPKEVENVEKILRHYLDNEPLRKQVALQGRETVMHNHTWDFRAANLIKELDPILKRIRESTPVSQ